MDAQRAGMITPLQHLVFMEVLTEIGDLTNCSILDVGCGWGALYAFLRARNFEGAYTGVDLMPHLLAEAKERYPEGDFRPGDILELDLPRYDYVLSSGLYDYSAPEMAQRLRATLARMFELGRRGMAWNKFLQIACTRPEHYGEPLGELLAVCDAMTPWVVMRRDYDPGHATFYLFKPAAFANSGMEAAAGRLFTRPGFRQRVEMEPEAVMAKYNLTAQELGRLLTMVPQGGGELEGLF